MVWCLIAIKLFIGAAILFFFLSTQGSIAIMASTHWFAPVIAALLLIAPAIRWRRLIRARLRRAQLLRAEWEVGQRATH